MAAMQIPISVFQEGSMHTSRYTIYVDLPGNDREVLLVHGYTGAYDQVPRRIADFLRSREGAAPQPLYGKWDSDPGAGDPVPPPSEATLEVLEAQGYLTTLSPEDEESQFRKLVERLHERSLHRPPNYIFMPTYDCNLRCFYCFQDHMRTDSRFRHLLHTMDRAMADRIFASLPHLEALHGLDPATQERRSFGFFGGEPLLAANRPIIEYLIRRALEVGGADLWAVTNATELEAYEDLLGPAGLARLQITLDGPPGEHDRRRIDAAGGGSYERIARNIDLALERGARVSVRLNVDRNNLESLVAVADELVARGWDRHPGFSAYTAAVQALNDQTDRQDTFGSLELDAIPTWPPWHGRTTACAPGRGEFSPATAKRSPTSGPASAAPTTAATSSIPSATSTPVGRRPATPASASAACGPTARSNSAIRSSKPGGAARWPAIPFAAAAATPSTAAGAARCRPWPRKGPCTRTIAISSPPASAPASRRATWSI
jgi:pyruvate-formate lyase-activating enzyme